MRRSCLPVLILTLFLKAPANAAAQRDQNDVIELSAQVLQEMKASGERGIPPALIRKAGGLVIIPNVIKAGFVVGGRHGRGIMLARDPSGGWTSPVFVSLTGGSIGFQAGIQSSDLILVLRTRRSVNDVVRRRKITLNADAGVAAGPVGREVGAGTDIEFRAEIYTYSRSRGLFAGASIDGSSLRLDMDGIEEFYGDRNVRAGDILSGQVRSASPAIARLHAMLPVNAPERSGISPAGGAAASSPPPANSNRPDQPIPPTLEESFRPPVDAARNPANAETALVESATAVIRDMGADADRPVIPKKISEQAYAVLVVPDLKRVGFVASGQFGRGVLVVRAWDGDWSNPIFVHVTGGGIGLQAGAQASEHVAVFKSRRAVNEIIRRRKITLGVDAAATAGPVGREIGAATDADMRAEIFTYSRSRGLFVGASLGGSAIRIDDDANERFYRHDDVIPAQIVSGDEIDVPAAAGSLKDQLRRSLPGSG